MKKSFIALFVLSIFPYALLADPLPLNPYDKDNTKIKAPVYSRLRPFYYPQKDKDGAYILAEATTYNEGTNYYIIDGHLYMEFISFFLYIPSTKTLPKPEIIDFWVDGEKYLDFRKQTLDKFRVHPNDGENYSISCGKDKSVKFTKKIIPSTLGAESSSYYQVTWMDHDVEYPFTLEECPVDIDHMTEKYFSYCDNNILYYDRSEFYLQDGKPKWKAGIFFCDLKNRTRGIYASTINHTYPHNPMGIPGTDWIIYAKQFDDGEHKDQITNQLVVRKKLTQEQADIAVKEYQEWKKSLQQEQTKK